MCLPCNRSKLCSCAKYCCAEMMIAMCIDPPPSPKWHRIEMSATTIATVIVHIMVVILTTTYHYNNHRHVPCS